MTITSPRILIVGKRLVIEWPDPKPTTFVITAEAFEELVEAVNDARNEADR